MRATRLDLDQFHNLINRATGNTMIWAPRQSGKTFALARKFVETRNSTLLCVSGQHRRMIDDYLMMLGCPDRRRDVYVQGASMRGRRFDCIFIDEVDGYHGDLQDLWASIIPTDARIVSISTPHGVRTRDSYERIFESEYTLNHEGVTDWRQPEGRTVVTIQTKDHFEREGGLFRI